MAQLGGTFNPSEHEAPSFEPLPKGKYPLQVIESTYEANKAGTGHNINLVMEVIDGQYRGRRIYQTLAYDNPSEIAVRIARGLVTSICHAVKVTALNDTNQLHNKPFMGAVKIRKGKDGYDDSNELQAASEIDASQVGANPSANMFNDQPQGGTYGQPNGGYQQPNTGYAPQGQQQQAPVQPQDQFQNGWQNQGQQQANWQGQGNQQHQGQQQPVVQQQQGVQQNQPIVDNSPVPDMQFNGNQPAQTQQQQQPQAGQQQQQAPNEQPQNTQQQGDLPPWL